MAIKINRRTIDKSSGITKATADSFENFTYKIGLGTDNAMSYSTYSLTNLLSRNRATLEAGYRSSWLIGQAVDVVAEDMTKAGITMLSEMSPDNIKKLQVALQDYAIWEALCNTIKWSRLYGGALAIILIDGAKYDTPLDYNKIGKNTFKGLLVVDRWMCEPSLGELVQEFNKDFGKPKFYRLQPVGQNATLPSIKIHYSRVLRFDGVTLPFYQKMYENHWGLSVVERIYDRLIAFDSATMGAAQLVYKSFLRTISVKGLRKALALGGAEENAVIKQFQYIKQMQSNEGITLLDSEDNFDIKANSFGGVADLLRELGQQVSGATGIPLVRLFGQSPSGFSTGDADLRNYYDNIQREQENKLRFQINGLLEVMSKSVLGDKLPEDFEFTFNSLWQMSDKEKAEIATADAATISSPFGAGLIGKELALKELKQSSRVTSRFTNITQDDLDKAKEEDKNAPPAGIVAEENPEEENPEGGEGLNENPSVSLESPSEVEARKASTVAPIAGRTASTQEREKESQRDEEEIKINPAIKPIGEVVKPIGEIVKPLSEMGKPILENIRENANRMIEALRDKFFTSDDFEESKHPRATGGEHGGEFVKKGTGSSSAPKAKESSSRREESKSPVKRTKATESFSETKRDANGKLMMANGKPLPAHIANMKIPPNWTNVLINPDPKGDLLVQGFDKKGKPQPLYSKEHDDRKVKGLIVKVDKLNKEFPTIQKQINTALTKGSLAERENAFITKLIANTSARIGSHEETLGNVKAYGVTTLEARHIVKEGDTVYLDFVGKHGVQNRFPVTDPKLSSTLMKLKQGKKPSDRLFNTDYNSFLKYMQGLGSGAFTAKDLRTKLANDLALAEIKRIPAPKSEKEYKKSLKAVATAVASRLNNTPGMALKSYILPPVWREWQASAGIR